MKKQNNKNNIRNILNSPISIIVALSLLIVGLLIYSRFLVRSTRLYRFSGFNKDFSVMNGTIFTNYNINYFGDSKILYTGEDKVVYDFIIGYYIKDGENYRTIAEGDVLETAKNKGVSLKDLLEKSDFSFTEGHKDSKYLSKENIRDIDKLIFRISARDSEGKDINIEVPLSVVKVTK